MNLASLRPAADFALRYGAKTVCYGPPGVGKTPVINTAPRPLLCICEPGMLSMRASTVPAFPAFTGKAIEEFFTFIKSPEAKNFDTICIDSVSQMAEIILSEELPKSKDLRAGYGSMSRKMVSYMYDLYFMQNKHTYLIAKQSTNEGVYRPYFPGQDLNVKIPHLFDIILFLATHSIPGYGQQRAFRTSASFDCVARDRSGKLAEFEPLDLTAIFNKVMS